MNHTINVGDEFAFIGKDFVDGIAFLRIVEINGKGICVSWERQVDKSWWASYFVSEDFYSHDYKVWNINLYSVVKIESEEQKLFLQLKHNG